MITTISITIFASFLFAITNHIDKFLVTTENDNESSIKTLLVFSSLIAGIILSPIWLIISNFSISISLISLICVLIAAIIYILATYFYFKALEENDTSIIAVLLQLNPVFCYILGLIIFKENLQLQQLIGSLIIITSAILITIDFKKKNIFQNFKSLLIMILSCFCFGIYFILFDIAIRNSHYNACAFWYQIGLLIVGIILISTQKFHSSFITSVKTNGKKYFSLNALNELLNLLGNLLLHFTNITIPLALTNVLNGFQSAFVFILGIIGVKLLPKYFTETLTAKIIFQKVCCIILSIIGLIIMFI